MKAFLFIITYSRYDVSILLKKTKTITVNFIFWNKKWVVWKKLQLIQIIRRELQLR